MKRIIYTLYFTFILIIAAHGQNIGIGTTTPDSSAILDISSANKGLLIPRIALGANTPGATVNAPATGLMVFNTNPNFSRGMGLYINMGTRIAPSWTFILQNNSGDFIRNQSTQQTADFNITGSGVVGGALFVGATGLYASTLKAYGQSAGTVLIDGHATGGLGITILNTTHAQSNWQLNAVGTIAAMPGAFRLRNDATGATPIIAMPNGYVAINKGSTPTAALDVHGDIAASGSFLVDMKYQSQQISITGHHWASYRLDCPAGYQVVSGGGGHRDANSAATDITVNYSGPYPDAPTTAWRVIVTNNSGSSRALLLYCNCARIK